MPPMLGCRTTSENPDLKAKIIELPLHSRQAARELVPVRHAHDGLRVVLSTINYQEVVVRATEAIHRQKVITTEAIAFRDSLQHYVGISQIRERHRSPSRCIRDAQPVARGYHILNPDTTTSGRREPDQPVRARPSPYSAEVQQRHRPRTTPGKPPPDSDLPQRPRTTSPPGVRI